MTQNSFKLIFKTFVICLMMIANTHFAYAQSASILPPAKTTFFDANGNPLVNGKVYHYVPGTTTFKTTWQDSGETVPNTNPVTLDAAGRALILGDGSYRQIVKDRNGNTIWDAATSSTGSGGGGTATVGDGDLVGTVKPWAGMIAPSQYAFAYGQEFTRVGFPLLFSTLTTQQNASCTSGVASLTGLSDTSNIPIGAPVESSCVAAGTTVISKTASTVGTSSNAIVSTSTTARFFPYGNGDGSTTFNVPDLRGKVVAGRCNMGGVSCSNLTSTYFGVNPNALSTGGTESKSTTLLLANLPTITSSNAGSIPLSVSSTVNDIVRGANAAQATGALTAGNTTSAITSTGTLAIGAVSVTSSGTSSTPILTSAVQPTQLLNYIIKTLPDTNANSFFGVASIGGMQGVLLCGFGITCAGNTISAVASTVPAPTALTLGGIFQSNAPANQFSIGVDLAGNLLYGGGSTTVNGQVCTIGSSCTITAVAGTITVGTTTVASGTNTRILFNNAGVLGEYATVPLAVGGTNANLTASNGGIFWSNATQAQILAGTATARLPLLSGATATPVWGAYTLPASVTSGGIPYFSSTSAESSSALLTANAIMLGGGAGTAPSTLGSLGTTTTLLHGNAAGAPSFGAVVSADMNITTTSCTNQFVTAISAGGVGTCTTDTLASAQHANQGTTTQVLHGNAAGNPSWAAVGLTTDVTGTLPIGNGGTAQTTALAARGSSGLNIDGATSTGDANYTILSTDRMVYHTALSAPRTDTLPAANSVNAGQVFYLTDFRGVATGTNTITLARAGADTINGVTSVVAINAAFGAGIFWSDGASRWTFQPTSTGGGGGTVTQVVCGGVTITGTGTCPPSYGLVNHSLAVSAAGSALTIALKDNSGADPSATSPVTGVFRNATGTTGSWVQRSVTAANSLVISSGSTLGVTSSTAFRIWVVLFDDAGTMRLGAINCSTSTQIYPLNEGVPTSSTAEGGAGAADNAGTFYTGTAVTSKSFLIVGYVEWSSTGLTAGTWTTTNLNFIQSFGPGIKKPGDVIQGPIYSTTSTGTTVTNSTTQTQTNLTATLTPTSAANLIRIKADGNLTQNNSTAGSSANAQLSRGTGPTLIGNLAQSFAQNGISINGVGLLAIDKPNTASSQQYSVYVWCNTSTNTTAIWANSTATSMYIEEIQG